MTTAGHRARRARGLPEPAPGAGVPARQRRQAARPVRRLPRRPRRGHRHHRARAGLGHAACRSVAHWQAIRLSVVRGFAAYLHSIDPAARGHPGGPVPPGGVPGHAIPVFRCRDRRADQAAAALRPRLRAATYQTLIGLLAVTGIRVGEAIALDTRTSTPAGTAGGAVRRQVRQARLVPLHPSAVRALARYLQAPATGLHPTPGSPALFVSTAGTRLLHCNVAPDLRRGWPSGAGLTRRSASCRPAHPRSATLLRGRHPARAGTATAPTSRP